MSLAAENLPVPEDLPYGEAGGELPIASFEEYRALCDSDASNSWRVGILSPESYAAALGDKRTVFGSVEGRKMPVVAAIDHETSYDATRCRGLTERQQVMLLTVPLSQIHEGVMQEDRLNGGEDLASDFALVIAEPASSQKSSREEDHQWVLSQLNGLGMLEGREFVDPRLLEQEGHETAWMGLYSFSCTPGSTPQAEKPVAATIDEAWQQYCEEKQIDPIPAEGSQGKYLLSADQLKQRPEIVESLWEITQEGFGEILGAYHPVSMEEGGKEAFKDLLLADGAYASVYYHEGKPVCFGLISFSIDSWSWMNPNSTAIQKDAEAARAHNETPAYFAALISNTKGMRSSHQVLELFFDLSNRTGIDYRVMFESTNLSATYIPRIATRQVERSENAQLKSPVQLLDRVDYWFAVSNPGLQVLDGENPA